MGAVASALLAAAAPVAQAPASAPNKPGPSEPIVPSAFMAATEAVFAGRYLDAVDRLKAAVAAGDRSVVSLLEQVEPFITGVPAVPRPAASAPPLDAELAGKLRHAVARDAIAAIVERARNTRIVILNEAHDEPRHRAFGLDVARALRPLGYTILAAEALMNNADAGLSAKAMAALATEGYPRRGTGFYINDPVFGDFIRQALALGYRPVAYEQTSHEQAKTPLEGIIAREQEQAENLARHIAAAGPNAKILIYVGYSHAAEAPVSYGENEKAEWMAARLKRMTGIDPLTIDQTELRQASPSPAGSAAYDILSKAVGRRSAVLSFQGRFLKSGNSREALDLQVVHPPVKWVNGRPDWLRRMSRRPVAVPPALRPAKGRRLVQAFVAGEAKDAVPVDQVLVVAGNPLPRMMLPAGPIRYAWQE